MIIIFFEILSELSNEVDIQWPSIGLFADNSKQVNHKSRVEAFITFISVDLSQSLLRSLIGRLHPSL